jgi:hypothetical protein
MEVQPEEAMMKPRRVMGLLALLLVGSAHAQTETHLLTTQTLTVQATLQPDQGQQGQIVQVVGSGGAFGSPVVSLDFQPAGVQVVRFQQTPDGQIQAVLSIASWATPGPYDLQVTTQNNTATVAALPPLVSTYPGVFTVQASAPDEKTPTWDLPPQVFTPDRPRPDGPRVVRVEPSQLELGKSVELKLTGENFRPGMTVDLGSDITQLTPVLQQGFESATLRVEVAPNAVEGPRVVRARAPGFLPEDGPATFEIVRRKSERPNVTTVHPQRPLPTGPRVDRIQPEILAPGSTVTAHLYGRNFAPGMRLAMGPGISIAGVANFGGPGELTVDLRVDGDAEPGPRVVVAEARGHRNVGPAQFRVRDPNQLPPIRVFQVQPKVTIQLEKPGDPYSEGCFGDECMPPTMDDETEFQWSVSNPGVCDYYELELVDGDGNILAKARTTKLHYHPSVAFLATLPAIPDEPYEDETTHVDVHWDQLSAAEQQMVAEPWMVNTVTQSSQSSIAGEEFLRGDVTLSSAQTAAAGAVVSTGVNTGFFDQPWTKLPSLAFWRVKGYWKKLGTADTEDSYVVIGESTQRAILLPLPPRGADDCSVAPVNSKIAASKGRVLPGQNEEPPCDGGAVICAGSNVALSGTIDLSRNPYDPGAPHNMFWMGSQWLHMSGGQGDNDLPPPSLSYANVFVDWGDGTAPEPLKIDKGAASDPKAVQLVKTLPGLGAMPLEHVYTRHGSFQIRIYSLNDAPKELGPLSASTSIDHAQTQLNFPGGTSQNSSPVPLHFGVLSVGDSNEPANQGVSQLAGADLGASLSSQGVTDLTMPGPDLSDAFLIACTDLEVVAPPGEGANDPLKLLSAEIVWSEPYDAQDPPSVSACSEAFAPRLKITYWGKGYPRVRWYLDGSDEPFHERDYDFELPGVSTAEGNAGTKPFFLDFDGMLPLEVQAQPHTLRAVVSAGAEPKPPANPQLFLVPGLNLGQGQSGPQNQLDLGQNSNPGVTVVLVDLDILAGPPTKAEAPPREYVVTDPPADQPCTLRYPIEGSDLGFTITDLTDLDDAGGTWSGKGQLRLDLPGANGSVEPIYVPIEFSGWQLLTEGQQWEVQSGTLDVALDLSRQPLSFQLELTHLSLQPSGCRLTGSFGLSALQKLPTAPGGGKYAHWDFEDAPISPDGDFYLTLNAAGGEAAIGYSGVSLDFSKVVVDLSTTEGSASANVPGCSYGTGGTDWIGVIVDGTVHLPKIQFGNLGVDLSQLSFTGWTIGSGGLTGQMTRASSYAQASFNSLQMSFSDLELRVCNGSFTLRSDVSASGLPLIPGSLDGNLQITSGGDIFLDFDSDGFVADMGVARLAVSDVGFGLDPQLGSWALSLDAELRLQLDSNNPVFTRKLYDMRVTLDGRFYPPSGTAGWFPVTNAGASLAGFGVQVTELGIGPRPNGGAWFGISGKLELTSAFEAVASRATFKLRRSGTGYASDGIDVDKLQVDFALPAQAPTVKGKVTVGWHSTGSEYRFEGNGSLHVIDCIGIQAGFLYGKKSHKSYWLARAQVDLASGIPMGPLPLSIYRFKGGVGENVALDSFQKPLSQIQPTLDGSFLLYAGVGVGTSDKGFTAFVDGALTIKFGGSDKGVRIDASAWFLQTHHQSNPQAQACLRMASGSFDMAAGAELSYLSGKVRIHAAYQGDPCNGGNAAIKAHFGKGSSWYIYFGQKPKSLRVSAHVITADGNGYLMISPQGVAFGGGVSAKLGYEGHAWGFGLVATINTGMDVAVAFTFDPVHIYGEWKAYVQVKAGLDTPVGCLCISPSLWAQIRGGALPIELCASAKLRLGRICWCFVGCCHTYELTLPNICI